MNTDKKKFIGLDLLTNPKKSKPLLDYISKPKTEESNEFREAKKNIIEKLNLIKESDLNFKPNNEIDTTIHVLFKYMLYKPYINEKYDNIK